jgi:hypothetical protein
MIRPLPGIRPENIMEATHSNEMRPIEVLDDNRIRMQVPVSMKKSKIEDRRGLLYCLYVFPVAVHGTRSKDIDPLMQQDGGISIWRQRQRQWDVTC